MPSTSSQSYSVNSLESLPGIYSLFRRINPIGSTVTIILPPTTAGILMLAMTYIDDTLHGVGAILRVASSGALDIRRESDPAAGRSTDWDGLHRPAATEEVLELLGPSGIEGEMGIVVIMAASAAGSASG